MTTSEQDAERLAQARQQLAVDNPFGPATRWDALTDHERKMAVLEAANYLKALEATGYAVIPPDEVERLRGERDAMLRLIGDLADADDCWFDYHGGCQAHGYLSLEPGAKCPQQEAKELIEAANSGEQR